MNTRAAALLTFVCFGCATVRVPSGAISEPIPVRDGVAEPQVALWIEDTKGADPAATLRASAAARAALAQALEGRTDFEGDAMLVVRAQGVTRTPARRKDQKLAVAGLVVGSVAVVAAVVAIAVATKGKGVRGKAPASAAAAPAPKVASGARPAPRPGGARPSAPPRARPSDGRRHGVGVWPAIGVHVDAAVPLSTPGSTWTPPPPPAAAGTDPDAGGAAPDGGDRGASVEAISLARPQPLPVDARGFFAGDEIMLELVLVDRHDGTPLWTKVVRREVDPCDARAVRRVVDDALAGGEWLPAASLAPAP